MGRYLGARPRKEGIAQSVAEKIRITEAVSPQFGVKVDLLYRLVQWFVRRVFRFDFAPRSSGLRRTSCRSGQHNQEWSDPKTVKNEFF